MYHICTCNTQLAHLLVYHINCWALYINAILSLQYTIIICNCWLLFAVLDVKIPCSPIICARKCPHGLQKDKSGCAICACADTSVRNTESQENSVSREEYIEVAKSVY